MLWFYTSNATLRLLFAFAVRVVKSTDDYTLISIDAARPDHKQLQKDK